MKRLEYESGLAMAETSAKSFEADEPRQTMPQPASQQPGEAKPLALAAAGVVTTMGASLALFGLPGLVMVMLVLAVAALGIVAYVAGG